MTELILPRQWAEASDTNAAVAAALESMVQFLQDLVMAADACKFSFNWVLRKRQHTTTIPFLDTDIVRGALPSDMIFARETLRPAEIAAFAQNPQEILGPQTVHHLLRTMPHFCLPPGTVWELGSYMHELPGEMSSGARRITDLVERGKQGRLDPQRLLSPRLGAGRLADQILEEFRNFADRVGDLTLLESVVDRSIRYEDLVDDHGIDPARRAFVKVRDQLNHRRPGLTVNNFSDAVNFFAVVHAFNSKSGPGDAQAAPVLISKTQEVLDIPKTLSGLFSEVMPDRPKVVENRSYLVISEGLLCHTERNFAIAADLAVQLIRAAVALQDACRALANELMKLPPHGRDWLKDDSRRLDWELLELKADVFAQKWQPTLAPAQRAERLDHAHVANFLQSPKFIERVRSRSQKLISEAFKELEYKLKTYRPATQDFWQLLQYYRHYVVTAPPPESACTVMPLAGCEFYVWPADTPLLSEMRGGGSRLQDSPGTQFDRPAGARVGVAHRYMSDGAILAVDTWWAPGSDGARWLRVVWLHDCDEEQIWRAGVNLLSACAAAPGAAASKPASVDYRVFPPGRWDEGNVSIHAAAAHVHALRRKLDARIAAGLQGAVIDRGSGGCADGGANGGPASAYDVPGTAAALDYFELDVPPYTFLADTVALGDIESQAGLVFPAVAWSAPLCARLAQAVNGTSLYPPGESMCRDVLNYVMHRIGIRNPGSIECPDQPDRN